MSTINQNIKNHYKLGKNLFFFINFPRKIVNAGLDDIKQYEKDQNILLSGFNDIGK